jgi:2-polyprenyl-6-methoxyphenol hydroxylase-like FAD-dependent oxidoreductase
MDIYDRPPVERWGQGRVTLLGDAAHPMTTNLAQGACQAIEDAVVIARNLSASSDIPAALRTYETQRIPRTSSIVKQSSRLASLGRWKNPVACSARDRFMKIVFNGVALRQHERDMAYEF